MRRLASTRFPGGRFAAFLRDESGATAIEYGLIVATISIVVITAVTATGRNLWNTMGAISNATGH